MSMFGWSYPPGAANDPNAPWNAEDGPCAVCGKTVDDCICPECPQCGSFGDPRCYKEHGRVRSQAQIESLAAAEKYWEEEAERESRYYEEMLEAERLAEEYWKQEAQTWRIPGNETKS